MLTLTFAAGQAKAMSMAGTIADAGSGWNYFRVTTDPFTPRTSPVTIQGTVDLTNLGSSEVLLIGLLDKGLIDGGTTSGWQSGAYGYFGNTGSYKIGPSDGNMGGELVDVFGFAANPVVAFSLVIGDGTIDLTFGGNTYSDTYGDIEKINVADAYPGAEFDSGAYFGMDFWGAGSVTYDLTITQEGGENPHPRTGNAQPARPGPRRVGADPTQTQISLPRHTKNGRRLHGVARFLFRQQADSRHSFLWQNHQS